MLLNILMLSISKTLRFQISQLVNKQIIALENTILNIL